MKKALLDEQVLFRRPKTEDSKMQKYLGGLQQKGRKKKKKEWARLRYGAYRAKA